ncbi:hypothetical protein RRG08_060666 [Elysia crispata]|uniref:Uncharacterized protein n=1 Tax=Elysia crispata TaxID=231223 RepID=A0AAE1E4W5_9GAST|nr:hypothetical protein RRG08_060666 [Elysia crispata]
MFRRATSMCQLYRRKTSRASSHPAGYSWSYGQWPDSVREDRPVWRASSAIRRPLSDWYLAPRFSGNPSDYGWVESESPLLAGGSGRRKGPLLVVTSRPPGVSLLVESESPLLAGGSGRRKGPLLVVTSRPPGVSLLVESESPLLAGGSGRRKGPLLVVTSRPPGVSLLVESESPLLAGGSGRRKGPLLVVTSRPPGVSLLVDEDSALD